MKKNKIYVTLSMMFIIFFVFWISGCGTYTDRGGEKYHGCASSCAAQTRDLRWDLEIRTGQDLSGWTHDELIDLEKELDRLEEEKREPAQAAQPTEDNQGQAGQEVSQSQSVQEPFISDEDPNKKETGSRNAPSSGYESYYDEQNVQDISDSRDLNGRWKHQSNGEIVAISGNTGSFEAFSSTGQKFADLGMIQIGDNRFHNLRPIRSFSELDDMRWLGGYLLEIKNTVGDADFSDIAALWRCSPTIFVLDGYNEEPIAVEVESGDRDAVIILLPDGDTFYLSTSGARTLQELQNNFTYFRVK